ncbi:hypothetical protein FB471_4458 [Amycolatopsis cihanbeyliensis]|uniref:Uncharacterized protein n=1 Tax=Amycolatopsis cihanbeyliensis TaxID=1128664 RepID=A0A542DNW3_AMYCI|nr:hypothetical protein FB471_4458 [Amycolatopsis cihanbeyliensis]
MPLRMNVPLPGPFSFSMPIGGPSRSASWFVQLCAWLIIGPFLVAGWAIIAAAFVVVWACWFVWIVWRSIYRLVTRKPLAPTIVET